MKKSIFLSLIMLALAGCSITSNNKIVGQYFPHAKLTMLDGTTKMLSEWRGRPIVLVFWSAGCPSCENAIDQLNEEGWTLRKGSDIVFIAVNLDLISDFAEVQARSKDPDLRWFLHAFSGNGGADEAFQRFQGSSTPLFVLMARDGKVMYTGASVDPVLKFMKTQASWAFQNRR